MRTREASNPKRRLRRETPDAATLDQLAKRVGYGGNPEHKRNPGDFDLHPPAHPRADKTLCDEADIHKRAAALRLLRLGIRRGLISEQMRGGFPQNVWSVTADGIALEAPLENPEKAAYHGYPMSNADPLRAEILARWSKHDDQV